MGCWSRGRDSRLLWSDDRRGPGRNRGSRDLGRGSSGRYRCIGDRKAGFSQTLVGLISAAFYRGGVKFACCPNWNAGPTTGHDNLDWAFK